MSHINLLFKRFQIGICITIFLFLISGKAIAQTCDDNMTSYWKLVEDGNTIDYVDSVGGNSAYCLTDCPAPSITGITNINGSQEFDGVDDEVIADADGTFDWSFASTAVVPEPISSTLFIVGGATLGFRRFWKKRRNI